MKNLMNRAWEIYRTLTGDHIAKLATALKMAWAETKTVAKKVFDKAAKVVIAGRENYDDDVESKYLYFNAWEKFGKKRIYVNDYKGRSLGFIENGEYVDNKGVDSRMVKDVVNEFKNTFAF